MSAISEGIGDIEQLDENLRKWFKEKWVRFGPDGKIRGACARGDDSEGKPKCLPQKKAQNLGKKGRKYAASKKRREDPNPERTGKAKNVATKKKTNEGVPFDECPKCRGPIVHESMMTEKQDACYHKVKSRYKVWPSAYASGALVQCRKKGASNWGTGGKKDESSIMKGIVDEASGTPGGLERYRTPAMVNATMQQSLYKRELAPIKAAEKKRKEAEYRKNNPSVSVPSIQIGASTYPIHIIHNWIGSKDLNAAVEFAVNKFAYRQSKDFKTEIAGDPDFQKAVKNFFNVAEKSLNHRDSTRTKSHWDGKIRAAPRETDTSSDGFDAINKINDALLPYYKKYGVDKTGRRVPPGFNYNLEEAKAKPYVKPFIENGKQVGWKSSDGYHVKYWQMFAKDSAIKHAKLNPDEVDEGQTSLDEGVKQQLAKAALAAALTFAAAGQAKADVIYSYLDPGTKTMKTTYQKAQVPTDASVVFKVDTDTNQTTVLKGPGSENQDTAASTNSAFTEILRSVKNKVADQLIDPDSVRYKKINIVDTTSKSGPAGVPVYLVVGELNSKNRMGGYTGGTYFGIMLDKQTLSPVTDLMIDPPSEYGISAVAIRYSKANKRGTVVYSTDPASVKENYTGEFAAEKTPAINPYGGLKDNKFRGAISEEPTDNPTGASGEGGQRTYRPKSAGRLDETTYEYDADELLKMLGDYQLSKPKGDPSRGVATRIMNALHYYKGGKVTRAELLRAPGMGKQGMVLIDTLLGRTTSSTDPYAYFQSQIIEYAEHLKNAIAKKDIRNAEDLLSKLKSALNALKRSKPVDEDTSYAGGMGQGGNAGQSYRKFKPKSAGTFKEDELDEACWKGYHKEGNKKMFGKTYPNCVKNTNEEQLDELSPDLLSRAQQKAHDQKQNIIDKAKSRNIDLGSYGDPKGHPVAKAAFAKDEQERKFSAGARKASERDQDRDALKDLSPAMKRKIGIEEEQLDEKCWDTHKQVGMKNKGGRQVPNCVPKESAIMKGLKSL